MPGAVMHSCSGCLRLLPSRARKENGQPLRGAFAKRSRGPSSPYFCSPSINHNQMFLRLLNRLATSADDPCDHGPGAARMNRELSAVKHPIISTVLSICPKHAGGELKFVIGIEAKNESLDYLIDTRSAILLAHGLLDYLKPTPFIRVRWDAKRGCLES